MCTNIENLEKYDFTEDWDVKCINEHKEVYEEYKNADPLEKYFIYKMSSSNNCPNKTYDVACEFWKNVRKIYAEKKGRGYKYYINDPDTYSDKLQEIYKEIYLKNYLEITKSDELQKKYLKIIKNKEGRICGDTMNSITTTMSKYFRGIFAENKEYYLGEKGNGFVNENGKPYNGSLSQSLQIYLTEKNEKTDKFKELSEKEVVTEFIRYNHTLGNFIPIPANTFNVPRSRSTNDYWDLTLYYIYKWYKAVEGKSVDEIKEKECSCDIYGDNLCTLLGKNCPNVKKCIDWLCLYRKEKDDKPSWDEFVKMNFLSMYVCRDEDHYGMPKLLWCNNVTEPMELKGDELKNRWKQRIKQNNNPSIESCEKYFKNAKECICKRTGEIVNYLSKNQKQILLY